MLAAAIDSVVCQTVADLEVIVVDDRSPDPVRQHRDPRVRVVRHGRNRGPAVARNTGIEAARGRYVAFLDDDDIYAPDRLERVVAALARAPVVICWSRWLDGPPRPGPVLEGDVADTIGLASVPHVGATTVERRALLAFDGRFDAVQDVDWWFRMAACRTVTTVPHFGYFIRRHPEPRHRNDQEARIRCTQLLFEVHAAYFAAHPRAASYRWKRLGLLYLQQSDRKAARDCFRRSIRLHPNLRDAYHLARSLGRGRPSTFDAAQE
jgi:glycosyltransferase involved in cell wall biosynthesis